VVALIGWLIKSWADETQRTALEEAINTERIVSGVEWTQLREANRLTVGEFVDIVRACLELFPEGTASGDDFLWVVERVMAESRQKRMHERADAAAARVHLKVSAMRESEEARRRHERTRLLAQNRASTDAATAASRRAWLSALTLGLVGGGGPSAVASGGARAASAGSPRPPDSPSWFGSSPSEARDEESTGDLFAGVYEDEAEASEAFNPSQSMQRVYGDMQGGASQSQDESVYGEEPAAGGSAAAASSSSSSSDGRELDLVDIDAWERSLPPLPNPDGAAELALHAALRALPPTSLVHRQSLERLMRALATGELRGDAGVSESGGQPTAEPKPHGVTTPLLKLAQFLEALAQGSKAETAAEAKAAPAAEEGAESPALPLGVLLPVLVNLIDESPEGRADALLAIFTDEHPLLAGPGSEVALPEGYSALQVNFKRRARTLGFAGTLRGGVSGGVSAVAPDERAVADGVLEGAAAPHKGGGGADDGAQSSRMPASAAGDADLDRRVAPSSAGSARGSLFVDDPADLTEEAADLMAELLEAEAALPVATEPRSTGFAGQEPLPERPALAPDAVRVADLVRAVSALQATWQLVPGSVVEREQLLPYPLWRRRGAESSVKAACERLSVTPAVVEVPAPRSGCAGFGEKSVEVLSRADVMRVLWSNDVCAWGSCPAETGPLRPRPASV
jgi:hypothetical protein